MRGPDVLGVRRCRLHAAGHRPNKFGDGELFPALFDGKPAVLALRPPADGEQQVDVLACGTAASLASVTIAPR